MNIENYKIIQKPNRTYAPNYRKEIMSYFLQNNKKLFNSLIIKPPIHEDSNQFKK